MNNNKQQPQDQRDNDDFSKGPHIAHKSPTEDADLDTNNFVQQTQKAKQKVDADITNENERPAEQS